jgi:hypothetical protein
MVAWREEGHCGGDRAARDEHIGSGPQVWIAPEPADYWSQGRTMANLGLAEMDKEAILKCLNEGLP